MNRVAPLYLLSAVDMPKTSSIVFTENLYTLHFYHSSDDLMKIWKIVVLCMVAALLAAPAVSAKEGYTVRPSTEETPPVSILVYDSITQGQTKTYTSNVGTGVNYLEVDLNWGDTADSLSLKIYTPGGSRLGTFYDIDDGVIDGRIHLDIVPNKGYVESGEWEYKVYGVSVIGTEDYNFNVAQH